MNRRQALAATLALLLFVFPTGSVHLAFAAFPITVLTKEGDVVTGVGTITSITNLAIQDSGGWLVEVDTNADASSDVVVLKSGGLYLRENQSLAAPPGAALSSVDAFNLNNSGHSGWNFFLRNLTTTTDSGVFFDETLVIQESDISTAPELSANTPYIGFVEARLNDVNQIAVVASVDDPIIASTVDRALVILDLDGSGDLVSETAFAKEGQVLPGQIETVADFGTGPHENAFNNLGQMLYLADLTGDASADGALYLDLTKIAQEGGPSPVSGRNYETLLGRGLDLNNFSEMVYRANLNGDASSDEVILADGREVIREGGTLAAIAPFTVTAMGTVSGPVEIDDERNVLWFGDWNDPDTTKDTGLFLNDVLIVKKGAIVDGQAITTIASGQSAYSMSTNGRHVIVEVVLSGTLDAALGIEVQAPPPVADGAHIPGGQVQASLNPNGTDIDVTWDATSCAATQYNLFYGSLASVSTLTYDGAQCDLGVTGQATFTPPEGDVFFLIASEDVDGVEGGHGYDSTDRPRYAAAGGLCGVIGQIRSSQCGGALRNASASAARHAVLP